MMSQNNQGVNVLRFIQGLHELSTIDKLARHSQVMTLIGRLVLLSDTEGPEFDSFIGGLDNRLSHFEEFGH